MGADQRGGSLGHCQDVELAAQMPAAGAVERRSRLPVQVAVAVVPPPGGVAGMEALGCVLRAKHCHVERQVRVERCCQTPCREASAVVEVGHLPFGVSTGVRAPRGVEPGLLTGHCIQCLPQLLLDRAVGGLELPAGEVGAVVLEEEPDVSRATAEAGRVCGRDTAYSRRKALLTTWIWADCRE